MESKNISELTESTSTSSKQFRLISLIGATTICSIGLAIFAQLGIWAAFIVGISVPGFLFGIFCVWDACTSRDAGCLVSGFIGVCLARLSITFVAYTLIATLLSL